MPSIISSTASETSSTALVISSLDRPSMSFTESNKPPAMSFVASQALEAKSASPFATSPTIVAAPFATLPIPSIREPPTSATQSIMLLATSFVMSIIFPDSPSFDPNILSPMDCAVFSIVLATSPVVLSIVLPTPFSPIRPDYPSEPTAIFFTILPAVLMASPPI